MKKILIVDDSPAMRMVLRCILEQEEEGKQKSKHKTRSYKLFEAGSEEEALAQFKKEDPDLVLLDIVMPGGDEVGIDVLKKIREINSEASVIMISATGQSETIAECKRLGALNFIAKPFDDEEVLKIVADTLA